MDRAGLRIGVGERDAGDFFLTRTLKNAELKVEQVGFARTALTSDDSLGNAFELTVRELRPGELHRLRLNLPGIRP